MPVPFVRESGRRYFLASASHSTNLTSPPWPIWILCTLCRWQRMNPVNWGKGGGYADSLKNREYGGERVGLAFSRNMRTWTRRRIASWGDRETRKVPNEIGPKPIDKT